MAMLPYILAYLGIAVFAVAVVARFFLWSRMPMHVRWELYPVAHEASRAHYSGSYLEDTKWWSKPREVSMMGELKVMIPEILFLVALRETNPKLWIRSFPFHFGLYLTGGCVGLMVVGGILAAVAPTLMAGTLALIFKWAIVASGVGGMVLALIGALGLLQRRLGTAELRTYAAPADIFNLVFFIVTFGVALATFALVDRDLALASTFVANLVTFNMTELAGSGLAFILPTVTVVLLALLVAYIPLTHMSHFVGKYFAYHAIRWNDTPNLGEPEQEAAIAGVLARPVSWAGPHVKGDGKKTWADVATEEMSK